MVIIAEVPQFLCHNSVVLAVSHFNLMCNKRVNSVHFSKKFMNLEYSNELSSISWLSNRQIYWGYSIFRALIGCIHFAKVNKLNGNGKLNNLLLTMLAVVLFCHGGGSIYQKTNTSKLQKNTLIKQICLTRIKQCMDNNMDWFLWRLRACSFSQKYKHLTFWRPRENHLNDVLKKAKTTS